MTWFLGLLLAATPVAPTPAWLAGRWVPVSDASRQDAVACAGEDARVWQRDGGISGDTEGWWRLDRGRLIETRADAADGFAVSTVSRLGPDLMRQTDADGERVEWRRCR